MEILTHTAYQQEPLIRTVRNVGAGTEVATEGVPRARAGLCRRVTIPREEHTTP